MAQINTEFSAFFSKERCILAKDVTSFTDNLLQKKISHVQAKVPEVEPLVKSSYKTASPTQLAKAKGRLEVSGCQKLQGVQK